MCRRARQASNTCQQGGQQCLHSGSSSGSPGSSRAGAAPCPHPPLVGVDRRLALLLFEVQLRLQPLHQCLHVCCAAVAAAGGLPRHAQHHAYL